MKEHCRHDRWIVIKWLLNINYPGLISEQVINWFNVTGSRTPEHILECAKNGMFLKQIKSTYKLENHKTYDIIIIAKQINKFFFVYRTTHNFILVKLRAFSM